MKCPHCGQTIGPWETDKARNEAIIAAVLAGATYKSTGEKFGISGSRVQKITERARRKANWRPGNRRTTMVTRASGSQSTQHAPKAGQNKPISGGAAGQGKARGGASLPNITKTTAPKLPTKR